MISHLFDILNTVMRDYLLQAILTALGLSGGIYLFIAKFLWNKAAPIVASEARLADQTIKDNKTVKQYEDDLKAGKDAKIIDDERSSILN